VERAADGWVGFCVVTNLQWQAFAAMMGEFERAEGEWSLLSYRQSHRREAERMVEAFTSQHRVEDLLEEAATFRVPAAPVVGPSMLPEIEPFRSMGIYRRPPSGRFLAPRPPYSFSRSELRALGDAPALGQHNGMVPPAGRRAPAPGEGTSVAPSPDPLGTGLPFAGLRIIDFTAFWAGPYATALMAALGADVIKVESTTRPDPIRYSSSVPPSDPLWFEKSAIFGSCNANKRGVTLALDTPEGRDLALRLIGTADVVIENFTPRVMEKFGLDYPALAALRPGLVMVRMSAFGANGPWRDRPGFAQTMEQITGIAWNTGYADAPPLIPKGACDPIGGMHTVVALLLALEHRDRTGEGQLVESSLLETSANVAAEAVIEWSAYGRELVRDGNHGPEGSPQGVFRCRGVDDWVALSVVDDAQWRGLVQAVGAPAWARHPSYGTVGGRRDHATEIDHHLSAWTRPQRAADVARILEEHGVPASVAVPADHIDEVPELRGRNFWITIDHPVAGRHEAPGWPLTFSGLSGGWPDRPAPVLGEHNHEVLTMELGLSPGEIKELAARGIIGQEIGRR
jgi:crotonobetainyl-CoA:carnitine CoA-transferase CaiB-like acyl-CoA transferase